MSEFATPEWVKDAVFYQIFPDTFARSERVPKPSNVAPWDSEPSWSFKGGDLLGIVERLDYLADLGITALYLNPVFSSTANHRYHTYDYHHVDPMLGGDAAMREFLDEAHRRGIRVILDGVFNHASRGFFQFNHTLENGPASPYKDWFHFDRNWLASGKAINAYPTSSKQRRTWQSGGGLEAYGYECWWDMPALPKFNTDSPDVRRFLMDVAERWVKFGIDGWRLDVPMEIDDDGFWREFRARVKAINPQAYVLGEIWDDATRWLQGDQFDGAMNYPLQRAGLRFFGGDVLSPETSWGGSRLTPWRAVRFSQEVDAILGRYDWQVTLTQLNLLGSHDTARFLSQMDDDVSRIKLAFLFLMTVPGAPCIYYGDEIGLQNAGMLGDGARGAMVWDESRWDGDLRDHVRRCVSVRKAHAALRRGSFEKLYSNNQTNIYAFLRKLDREVIVVILNNGDRGWRVKVPVGAHLFQGTILDDVLAGEMGEDRYVVRKRFIRGPQLRAHQGVVLRAMAD